MGVLDNTKNVGEMFFFVDGKAKDTKQFYYWFARITAGMSIAEASAVLLTQPILRKNIEEVLNVKVKFDERVIREMLNKGE